MMTSAQRNFLTGSFNPMSLSPALWLDASDASTLYDATVGGNLVSPDGAVARWEDKSGNLRHAIQSTGADRPLRKTAALNGRGALLFDGSTDKLVSSLDISTNFSIVVVARRNSGTSACGVAGNLQNGGNIDGIIIGHFYAGSNNDCAAALTRISAAVAQTSRVNVGNNAFIASTIIQPSSYTGWINGANESTVSASYTSRDTSFTIGAPRSASNPGETINGNIAEILVFPTALNASDRQKVEAYLRAKWDITFNPLVLSPALWLSDTGSDQAVWPDISGNGRNATQSDASRRPAIISGGLNGRQVRRFDGVDDSLSLTTGLGMLKNVPGATVIAVYKWITNPVINKSVFFASVNANADLSRLYLGGGVASRKLLTGGRRLDNDSFARCDSSTDNSNSFFIHSGVINYANSDLFQYVNGTLDGVNTSFQTDGNTSNTDSSLITVGTAGTALSNCANVEIAEILVFPTALSLTDRQNVEAYLKNKWMPDLNPLSLSPALWLSDTGNEPSVWPDISGNGRNATQATAANQPAIVTAGLNGRQVRRFDGTSDYLTHQYSVSGDSTIFAVAYSTQTASGIYNIVFSAADQNTQLKCFMVSQTNTSNNWGTFRNANIASSYTLRTSFQIVSIVATSAGVSMKTGSNAAEFVADTAFYVDPVNSRRTVGASYSGGGQNGLDYFKGDIAEILIFPTALSDTDRQRVEAYLKNKWMPDFNPLSLSPALWLSDTGSDPSVWSDISGNGRNAVQATLSAQPAIVASGLNGRQVRRFDGVGDFYQGIIPISSTGTIITVFKDTKSTGRDYPTLISFGPGTNRAAFYSNGVNYNWGIGRPGSGNSIGNVTVPANTAALLTGKWDGVTTSSALNGSMATAANFTGVPLTATEYYIAQHFSGGYSWAGLDIAEILVFTTALSDTNRLMVEAYLRTKWGTP